MIEYDKLILEMNGEEILNGILGNLENTLQIKMNSDSSKVTFFELQPLNISDITPRHFNPDNESEINIQSILEPDNIKFSFNLPQFFYSVSEMHIRSFC